MPSGRAKHDIGALESDIAELRNVEAAQTERIDSVDRQAQKGLTEADSAVMAAETANEKAAAADRRAAAAQQRAQRALNQMDAVAERIEGRIANLDKYTVADFAAVSFSFNSDALGKEAISRLDDILGSVSEAQSGYLFELQGFTDNIGTEKYNLGLSDRRVEMVLRYLVSKNIPLYRISLVGRGNADPIADNTTAEGREHNRRVEIRILRSSDTVGTAAR